MWERSCTATRTFCASRRAATTGASLTCTAALASPAAASPPTRGSSISQWRSTTPLAVALPSHCRTEGGSAIIDYQMPLKARRDDLGVGKVDLFAIVDGTLPCIVELKVAGETNCGDTPLRALLEGLAYCAIVEANAADIASEIADQHGLSASRPTLVVMAPDDYWAGYRDHPRAGKWLSAVRDLISGLRDTLGLDVYLLALLDAKFEMGLSGQPARLIGDCRMVSVDEWLIGGVRG